MNRMMNRMVIIGCLVVFSWLMVGSKGVFGAEAPADFFRGKTLTLIVASDPGGGTDLIARTIAPFLTKRIGAKVKVENRKTDEGLNFLYNKGSRDGLTLGMKTSDAIIGSEILKAPGVQYETDKFNFIANVCPSGKVLQLSPKLPYKTLDALRKATGLKAGGTSAKGALAVTAAVMSEILGLDAKVITGFKGRGELVLAVARGEVDYIVSTDDNAARDEKDGYAVAFVTTGSKRSDLLPEVPALPELGVKVAKELEAVFKFVTFAGTALALPPGVPPERVEYLRQVVQSLNNNMDLQKVMKKLAGVREFFAAGKDMQADILEIKADKDLTNKLDTIFKKYTAVR